MIYADLTPLFHSAGPKVREFRLTVPSRSRTHSPERAEPEPAEGSKAEVLIKVEVKFAKKVQFQCKQKRFSI